jgi:hypothetical protein
LLPTVAASTENLPRPLRRHRLMTSWMRLTGVDPVQLVRIRDDAFGFANMSDGFLRLIVIDGECDLTNAGGATHRLAPGFAGHGLPLTPIRSRPRPAVTDLFAAPRERLVER